MPRVIAAHYANGQSYEVFYDESGCQEIQPSSEISRLIIAPSWIDIQINGAMGISFNSLHLQVDDISMVSKVIHAHGVGRYFPTLITGSFEQIQHGFSQLELARSQSAWLRRAIPGYHLEGPYISGEDGPRGAHPKEHVRNPDWDEFLRWQAAANGQIRLVTLAPERPGAVQFIERLSRSGVVVAIGHTAATPQQICDAVQAGARLSTHLGNGSHAMLPRHENYFWEQLAQDGLMASIISDGHHLPPAILQCIVRAKSLPRLIVTCDASSLAGLPPGIYQHWGTTLEILPSGKIIVAGTPFLAGSGQFTDECLSHLIQQQLATLSEAIDLVTVHPARLLGWSVPTVQPGSWGSLVLLEMQDKTIRVKQLI